MNQNQPVQQPMPVLKSGGTLKWLIIILVLVILGGGGYWYYTNYIVKKNLGLDVSRPSANLTPLFKIDKTTESLVPNNLKLISEDTSLTGSIIRIF